MSQDYLARMGSQSVAHPDINNLIYGISNFFFDSVEDLKYEIALIWSLRSHTTPEMRKKLRPPQVVSIDSNDIRKEGDERKSTRNMSHRYRKEERFTSRVEKDILKHISNYKDVCEDYSFTSDHLLKYFHSLFDGKAVRQ